MRQHQSKLLMISTENQVLTKIKKAKGGSLFFVDNFLRFGTAKAIGKALERVVDKGEISRVARGIYARLETHKLFGKIKPKKLYKSLIIHYIPKY
jgi:hypothetical protein